MHWLIFFVIGYIGSIIILASMYTAVTLLIVRIVMIPAIFVLILTGGYIASCIPYYRMTVKSNNSNAWLTFIPFTKNYILLKLSRREFSLFNLFHIKKRTSVYWARLLSFAGMPIFYVLVFFLNGLAMAIITPILIVLHPDLISSIIEVPAVDFVFKGIAIAGTLIYLLFIALTNWRINYDILMTYGMQKHAMWASILNVFCPIIMIIFSYMIMNKSPDYNETQ